MNADKYRCARCALPVKVRIPKGGDGSMLVPYRHKRNAHAPCDGHFYEAQRDTTPQNGSGDAHR